MRRRSRTRFVVVDPDHTDTRVKRGVTFDSEMLFVQDDQPEPQATASFGKPGVAYDNSKVSIGLGANDKAHTTHAGDTMTLSWVAAAPGGQTRVMTVAAVPEPTTYALLAGGLCAVGFAARRRKPV